MATSLTGGVLVSAVVRLLSANLRDTYPYQDISGLFNKKAPMFDNYPTTSSKYVTTAEVNAAWEKIAAES